MHLKELRLRKMLTQKALADAMMTTQQTVARWETGKTVLNAQQIKDLCAVLNCTAKQLLGDMRDPSESRQAPHLFPSRGAPFGTLRVSLKGGVKEYPIDDASRDDLQEQLSEMFVYRNEQSDVVWLAVWTLDNHFLIINPRHLRKIELLSDAVKSTPEYFAKEVYEVIENWPSDAIKGKTREACEKAIAEKGLRELQASTYQINVTFDDGSEEQYNLTENTAQSLFELTQIEQTNKRVYTLEVADGGYNLATFANLAMIAKIEVPANLFRQLIASMEH